MRKTKLLMNMHHSLLPYSGLPYSGLPYSACAQMCLMDSRVRWNDFDEASASLKRMMVVTFVAVLHFAAFAVWLLQPPNAPVPVREMEVMVALVAPADVQAENPPPQLPVRIVPIQQPRVETPVPTPLPVEPIVQQNNASIVLPSESVPVVAAALGAKPEGMAVPEAEPDYQAAYLNNRLTYPLSARRMGIQGRVVLNVEVLAEGVAGQISVLQSSGHEMLDRAALESVKSWRFVPARRAGQPFTKWFTVPIQFSLQDNK